VSRLLEILQEPEKIQAQGQPDNDPSKMCSLVPVVLGDVMRDKGMLFSGSGDRGDQGETVLQPFGDGKDAHGLELDVAVMTRSGALEHFRRRVKRVLA